MSGFDESQLIGRLVRIAAEAADMRQLTLDDSASNVIGELITRAADEINGSDP